MRDRAPVSPLLRSQRHESDGERTAGGEWARSPAGPSMRGRQLAAGAGGPSVGGALLDPRQKRSASATTDRQLGAVLEDREQSTIPSVPDAGYTFQVDE